MPIPNGETPTIDSHETTPSHSSDARTQATSGARRPKLLFLAYHFPPAQAIASVRTWNVAKYLTRLGWDVTVVTPEPRVRRHLENPEKTRTELSTEGIQTILTAHHWRCLNSDDLTSLNRGLGWVAGGSCRRIARRLGIDNGVGWIKPAERACRGLVPDDVDLILASGPPFAAFTLAGRLAENLGRPYILDYRDPWTDVPGMMQALQPMVVRREARLLRGAAAVTTVSQSKALDLDSRYGAGSKLHVVSNGYDSEEMAEVKPHQFGHFAIVYAGIFYEPERVITPVFAALQRLKAKGITDWYFHYYGDHENHVREEAGKFDLSDRVKFHGRVSRSTSLSAIRGANIAVVISSVLEKTSVRLNGIVPGKLFEIIGLGTPILLIAPAGSDIESIAQPTGLAHRFSGDDIVGIECFIGTVMSGRTLTISDNDSLTWARIAKQFDRVLQAELPGSQLRISQS